MYVLLDLISLHTKRMQANVRATNTTCEAAISYYLIFSTWWTNINFKDFAINFADTLSLDNI